MRQRMHYAWWTWMAALTLVIAAPARPVEAGVAVSPLKQELALRPGEQGTFKLTLTYHSRHENDAADVANLGLADIDVSEVGGVDFKQTGSKPDSAGKWIRMGSKQTVPLQPGESQTIECTVTPPLSAAPGEYYSAVLVTLANKGKTEQGVAVQFRIATGVFVTVLGRTFPKTAKITHCQFEWPAIPSEQSTPVAIQPATTQPATPEDAKLVVVLHNTGKARFLATGKMILLDSHSRIAFSAPLQSSRATIFGGNTRRFEAALTKPLPAGRYTAKVSMDYESTWSKARYELPVEILPEQAQRLALLGKRGGEAAPRIAVSPDHMDHVIPAGASRNLALAVTNSADSTMHCSAAVASDTPSVADAWITVEPGESTIARLERKSLRLSVHVPPDTPAGKYDTNVTIQAGPEGSDRATYTVPLEFEVKTEKPHD